MSKTIKIIDLINVIANNDKKPYQVKYKGDIYTLDCLNHYVNRKNGTSLFYALIDYKDFLNDTVEIIEEQEEIDIQDIRELPEWIIRRSGEVTQQEGKRLEMAEKINELVKAVKQLDKNIKEKQ